MFSTHCLISFYIQYAKWSAAGHDLMWFSSGDRYYIVKMNIAKLKMR